MLQFKRAETRDELRQILRLQAANLPSRISSDQQEKEGFVTVEHTLELLEQMNDACAHFIALYNDKVIGYALSMHPKFGASIDILLPMFSEIEKNYHGDDFIVMGQICIDREFRGQGLFRRLYDEMLQGIQPRFSVIITEVDTRNTRSLNAHRRIGFEDISSYRSDDREWILIKLEASK